MISFDVFNEMCIGKITDYKIPFLPEQVKNDVLDGYMKVAMSRFNKVCEYDLVGSLDFTTRHLTIDIPEDDLLEIADIISEGMVVQWCQPFVYNREILQLVLNSSDFTTYSPNELIKQVNNVYATAKNNFKSMKNKYSFDHGDLTDLHM